MKAPDLNLIKLSEALFLECSISQQGVPLSPGRIKEFAVGYKLNTLYSPEDRFVVIELSVSCKPAGDQKKLSIKGKFCTRLTYHVQNFEELTSPLEEEPHVTPNELLLLTLVSVSFSTTRGMILTKTAGTVLEGFTLPMMDARQLVKVAHSSN